MNNDGRAILDDLLARWHHHSCGFQMTKGYPGADIACRESRSSRQYDDENGALDSDIEKKIMRTIDFEVSEMVDPYRAAIYTLARNCFTGRSVWRHPRLPADGLERGIIVQQARMQITQRLVAMGVM